MRAWLSAIAIVLAYVVMTVLDGPTDHSTEVAQAQAIDDAYAAEAARLAQHARIQADCGPNAAWSELPDRLVQCFDKHGRKTILIAGVQP